MVALNLMEHGTGHCRRPERAKMVVHRHRSVLMRKAGSSCMFAPLVEEEELRSELEVVPAKWCMASCISRPEASECGNLRPRRPDTFEMRMAKKAKKAGLLFVLTPQFFKGKN